uniref:Uncharacterized protein n=1 Tax=Anguilla anguilla TaxID=7936 RepID=A0A0E9WEV1_ANGAN
MDFTGYSGTFIKYKSYTCLY